MEIIILLVPLAILLLLIAVTAFIWALRRGQFDDLDSPQWRILFEDQSRPTSNNKKRADDHDSD